MNQIKSDNLHCIKGCLHKLLNAGQKSTYHASTLTQRKRSAISIPKHGEWLKPATVVLCYTNICKSASYSHEQYICIVTLQSPMPNSSMIPMRILLLSSTNYCDSTGFFYMEYATCCHDLRKQKANENFFSSQDK